MTSHADRMFAEVDRQLDQLRAQTETIATRSSLLVATTAVAAAVLAARIQRDNPHQFDATWPVVFLIVATVLGIITLAPLLKTGPNRVKLQGWSTASTSTAKVLAVTELLEAKLLLIDANRERLILMACGFYLQAAAVIVAVVLALVWTVRV